MVASILISTNSNRTLFQNFLSSLSEYPTINEYDMIIVNDSCEYLISEKYYKRLNFRHIRKFDLSEKMGYGAANNLAAEYAECDYLIFMNDDIILKPNCLERMISILKRSEISAVQPKLIYPQSNLVQSTGHIFTKYTNAHALENASVNSPIVNQSHERQALTTALCATERKLFFEAGKFNTEYYNAWEGMEYTLKLTSNQHKCWYTHEAEAYHIRGGARNQYKLNEDAQSAIFWTTWSSKIKEDLHKIISEQFTPNESCEYLVLNFSKLPNPEQILNNCGINIADIVSYTYISGEKALDFFRCLPNSFCRCDIKIIYFTNNYTQVKNNVLWFGYRSDKDDLIIDLSGNVIHTNSLIKAYK